MRKKIKQNERTENSTHSCEYFSVNPELVKNVHMAVNDEHGRSNEEGQRQIESDPACVALKDRLPQSSGQIVVDRRVMNLMRCP